jgi:hypothetical protein
LPIQPRGDLQNPPLSFAQERLWVSHQLEPGSPRYNMPALVQLRGSLNQQALEHSFTQLIARHEILRTTFDSQDGQPYQLIHPPTPLTLALEDLSTLEEAERQKHLQKLSREQAQEPFDLQQGPLLRLKLVRLQAQEHVLLLTMHHIISDGWSIGVLIKELHHLYEAALDNRPASLAALDIQYADYALWQREWLQGEVLEEQLDYWRKQLNLAPPVIELPVDRARPAQQSYSGATLSLGLSESLTAALRQMCQRHSATLFMLLLTAFKVLLYRYSGQSDLSVGTPIANRTRKEIEGLIGFFVNTLVLRSQVSGEASFCEVLEQEKELALSAYGHQDLPFEKLVEAMQPERDLSYTPLFQVMFILQNAPMTALQLPGLELVRLNPYMSTTHFDLTLNMVEEDNHLIALMEYNTDLFDESTIGTMLNHYTRILEAVVENSEVQVIDILLDSEDAQNSYDTELKSDPIFKDNQFIF